MLVGTKEKLIEEDRKIFNKMKSRPRSSSFGSCFKDSFICKESLLKLNNQSSPFTPVYLLCYAILQQDCALVTKLLHKYPGAVNTLTEDGLSPLHMAVLDGNVEILSMLLNENEANINIMDVNGKTALHYAVGNGYFDIAQYLIQHGSYLFDIRDGRFN